MTNMDEGKGSEANGSEPPMSLRRLLVFSKTPEAKEAAKKGSRARLIFDLLLFSILAIIAITTALL